MSNQPTEPGTLCRLKPLKWAYKCSPTGSEYWKAETLVGNYRLSRKPGFGITYDWGDVFEDHEGDFDIDKGMQAAEAHYRERISEAVEFIESPQEAPPETERQSEYEIVPHYRGGWSIASPGGQFALWPDGKWKRGVPANGYPTREAAEEFARGVAN